MWANYEKQVGVSRSTNTHLETKTNNEEPNTSHPHSAEKLELWADGPVHSTMIGPSPDRRGVIGASVAGHARRSLT